MSHTRRSYMNAAILVVDDTPANLHLLSNLLTEQGYLVRPVTNGPGAISSAQFTPPDLILLDIMMPDMDGYEICRQLKADERTREIPVLFISALQDPFDKVKAFSAGGVDYMTKPFDPGEVLARVKTHLALRYRNRELQLLNRIGQMLSSSLNLEQVLETALQEVQRLLDVFSTSIWLIVPETGELECRQMIGPGRENFIAVRLPAGQGITGWVAEHGESTIIADIFADPRHHETIGKPEDSPVRSMLSIPLKVKDTVTGVLNLADLQVSRFTPEDMQFVEPVAAATAIAIENARLFITAQQETTERIRKQEELEQERLITERLQRIDKLKDTFLANTSHELRTPLNGIIGLAESLIDGATGGLPQATTQNLGIIVSNGKRLATMVNDILDFSKLKNQELVLQIRPLSLHVAADVVFTLFRPLIRNKAITLVNTISAALPAVWADENRVQQILYNLIDNGIKFTEAGTITLSAEVVNDSQNCLAITVADTGIGIPADAQERVFLSFEQADGSIVREYGGTGLGLSITKQLVELHDGQIQVESECGQGARFTFTLPIVGEEELTPRPPLLQSEGESRLPLPLGEGRGEGDEFPQPTDGTPKVIAPPAVVVPPTPAEAEFTILVVDDEFSNVQVLANQLTLHNYAVEPAYSGQEALALVGEYQARGARFDLILLDLMMPKMSGYEVARRIRATYPPHELPIIMLTAKNQIADLTAGFSAGANDYITKPFAKEELLSRVKTHVQLAKTNVSYSRFVPHDYLKFLDKESIVEVNLGDHAAKEMAVMFSEMQLSAMSAGTLTSQEHFDFVNAYFQRVSPIIRDNHGFIVKFLGNGMMAAFPNEVDDAVRCGIAKLQQVKQYNVHRRKDGRQPVQVGIGIHAGHMLVGMVGEKHRMQGDAFSETVNLTARLEGLTHQYSAPLIISETVYNAIDPTRYHIRFLDNIAVAGKEQSIALYEVFDADPDDLLERKLQTQTEFAQGQQHYFNRKFADAVECFTDILTALPEDRTTKQYLKRSAKCLLEGVPDDWQGVETIDKK